MLHSKKINDTEKNTLKGKIYTTELRTLVHLTTFRSRRLGLELQFRLEEWPLLGPPLGTILSVQ